MTNAFTQLSKPRKAKVSLRSIDADLLRITDDPPPTKRVLGEAKYTALFKRLKPGQRIACEPHEAPPIAQALRKFLKDKQVEKQFDVRSVCKYPKDQRGGVWMIERPKSAAKP